MDKEKDFLEKEPVGKLLAKLAFPTVAAQLINMLYNIVDRIYIGHIPHTSTEALTGIGLALPVITSSARLPISSAWAEHRFVPSREEGTMKRGRNASWEILSPCCSYAGQC